MKSVQRTLIVGVLVGLLLGCIFGLILGLVYGWRIDPATYAGGAYPDELAPGYQANYLDMVIDSYVTNTNIEQARVRLQRFDAPTKIRVLAKRATDYAVAGQAVEAQNVINLAMTLKSAEGWSDETIQTVISQLTNEYQTAGDSVRVQAIGTFSSQLIGAVPVVETPQAGQPTQQPAATSAAPPAGGGGGFPWVQVLLGCLLLLVVLVAAVLLLGRWQQSRKKSLKPPQPIWEGEGPAPIKRWTGTYTLGQDHYDEFFTIETDNGDFLGESGMGIMETVPNSSPKQVRAFDVGLFDKTDITTLSRVVMSEQAYNDSTMRAKIEANPQAEAVLAEPGKTFTLETSAMRVEAKIDELEYGPGSNDYFNKLKLSLSVFLKEGADLKIGTMDIPDQFR
ncbi:MAG: hypothetical protein HYR94_16720 [Chloroflexi bacterium]|nr:hypothetical protein [Chloroflexota bacterium]